MPLDGCVFSSFSRQETRPTKDWPSLRGIEGDRSCLTAFRALNRYLYALAGAGCLRSSDRGQSFVLGLFTCLTPLRFIFETLVVEKDLFTSGPNEGLSAIYTVDRTILKLDFCLTPLSVGWAGSVGL